MKGIFGRIKDAPVAILAAASVVVVSGGNAAAQNQTAGDVANTLIEQMGSFGKLMVAGSVVGGIVMVATGLMKLKQASEDQGRTPYSQGMWRVGVGAGLIALTAFSGMLGATFGWNDSPTITQGGGASF